MTPEPSPFNGHTARLMRIAAVLVQLSLLLSAGAAVTAVVVAGRLDAERTARCVNSRTDTQTAIVAAVDEAGADPTTTARIAVAVDEALPVDEC